jgi:hypothetical protein
MDESELFEVALRFTDSTLYQAVQQNRLIYPSCPGFDWA